MKTFHTTKCRAYLHEKLSISKGVIRSRELALATEDEIASALGKRRVTNIKRLSIRKAEERMQTYAYILTSNQLHTLNEVKIAYCLERVEQYVAAPLMCFKCKKYGYHREACWGRQTCAHCGEKNPDHAVEDRLKQIRSANCRQDHPAYARSCDVSKKEKEILEVKHKRKVSDLEAREIVGVNMGENSYTSVARRAYTKSPTKQVLHHYVAPPARISLLSSLLQCPACLVRLAWIVFMMSGRWPYSCCFVGCCLQDLFSIARSILV